MFKFEDLRVYQEALSFNDEIYFITKQFPKNELFGLTNQLRRASVSITLNIAEGTSRTKKDFRHFIDLSRGSCYECIAILTIAKRRKYIEETKFLELYNKCNIITKMLNALITSLREP